MDETRRSNSKEDLVLLCIDNSEHSLRAFNWYYEHFYRKEHIIGLVHVYTSREDTPQEDYQRTLHEELKNSTSITRKFQELCKQRNIESRVFTAEKINSVGHTICKLAKENYALVIVMGQRGLGAIKRTILGSVSDHVLHHAHVTVLIVPHKRSHKH